MKEYALNAKSRLSHELGKNHSGRLRRKGFIPANLIANGQSKPMFFVEKDFQALVQSGLRNSSIIQLNVEGAGEQQVVVKELQRYPVNERLLHVDFYQITKGQRFLVKIAIETKNAMISKGIKAGGALEQYIRSIYVKTVPEIRQETIDVDLSNLDVDQAVHLRDLDLHKNWEVILDGNPIILKIARPRLDTTEAKEEAAPSTEEVQSNDE